MTTQSTSLEKKRGSFGETLRSIWEYIKNHRDVIFLIISILLIVAAGFLVYRIARDTLSHTLSCWHLVDESLGLDPKPETTKFSLCKGIDLQIAQQHINILDLIKFDVGPFPEKAINIVPGMKAIDDPLLKPLRNFLAWTSIVVLGVVSLVLAFVAIKIKIFIDTVKTKAGRERILGNLNIGLLIFVVICALFYVGVVVGS